jgi:hypothetical protein
MKQVAKRAIQAAVVALAATATLAGVTTPASAITQPSCSGSNDFTKVQMHYESGGSFYRCFANGGTASLREVLGRGSSIPAWVTQISTGNNRVQWYGDGRWQPATPIPKFTVFGWPHNPHGVSADAIRIV